MATAAHAHSGTTTGPGPVLSSLADKWWVILLRGIAAFLFGIAAFAWPGLTLIILLFAWAIWAITDGLLALVGGITGNTNGMSRWWLIIVGLAGIFAGLAALFWPGMTAVILLLYIAVWAIITGIGQIMSGFALRHEIQGEWLMIAAGAVSIIFGLFMLFNPGAGALALVWTIAIWAIVLAGLEIALAFKLKGVKSAAA